MMNLGNVAFIYLNAISGGEKRNQHAASMAQLKLNASTA
jgi:hypothetical protein